MFHLIYVEYTMLFFFQAEDGIRDDLVTGVQTCALPISHRHAERLPAQRRAEVLAGRRARDRRAQLEVAGGEHAVDERLPCPSGRARDADHGQLRRRKRPRIRFHRTESRSEKPLTGGAATGGCAGPLCAGIVGTGRPGGGGDADPDTSAGDLPLTSAGSPSGAAPVTSAGVLPAVSAPALAAASSAVRPPAGSAASRCCRH